MNDTARTNEFHHQARKRFGQNFLVDGNIIHNIIRAIHPMPGDNLVEIGPGQGAITAPLLEQAGQLQAVELDRDLAAHLRNKFAGNNHFTLHQADALKFDFEPLSGPGPLRIVGNLPYNISTPLIFHLLGFSKIIRDMHFMLQKEVVERMAASPGNKTYGRLSVIVQYHCEVVDLFTVPPTAFRPVPKVDSAIVRLTPRPGSDRGSSVRDPDFFNTLVKTAFQQRRKTLRNTLKQLNLRGTTAIDLGRRAETLSVEEFIQLSNDLGNP